jgi:leader peptidase (prepilin peptidase)/N-methyltransferase
MIRILGTAFAALLGLAFGSFLNVCLSRWPEGESIVKPRSYCHKCGHTLAWWENVPLVSWLALRGHCRSCRIWIGWRYPLVEASVGALWAATSWQVLNPAQLAELMNAHSLPVVVYLGVLRAFGNFILYWLLVSLAIFDYEHFWLPDSITLSGIGAGFLLVLVRGTIAGEPGSMKYAAQRTTLSSTASIIVAAGLVLLIRWIYWLIRRREGIGLGDAKLMAMLAAWLGLQGALLAFGLGVVLGAIVALIVLAISSTPANPASNPASNSAIDSEGWALKKLPLGTFLCIGGIVSSLWGDRIIAAYLHWAGF